MAFGRIGRCAQHFYGLHSGLSGRPRLRSALRMTPTFRRRPISISLYHRCRLIAVCWRRAKIDPVGAACTDCKFSEVCRPKGITLADRFCLTQIAKRARTFHKGKSLYRSGMRFTGIYAINSGSMKVDLNYPKLRCGSRF